MKWRLLALVAGAAALWGTLPCQAMSSQGAGLDGVAADSEEARAHALLTSAAQAAMVRAWAGRQNVLTVRQGRQTVTVLDVQHQPGAGRAVTVVSTSAGMAPASSDVAIASDDPLDAQMLRVLARHYALRVVGEGSCAGHAATVVEAHRPGVTGPGQVAGRFWVDRASHLVLRREVLDGDGSVLRSASYVTMDVAAQVQMPESGKVVAPTGQPLGEEQLAALRQRGWPAPPTVATGMELFEARLHEDGPTPVLQLSYSDGLSALSLFVQQGVTVTAPEGTTRTAMAGKAWVTDGPLEQWVWSGGGHTWTLLSDAPEADLERVVLALPHGADDARPDGLGGRLWRGLSRAGEWLNPFA